MECVVCDRPDCEDEDTCALFCNLDTFNYWPEDDEPEPFEHWELRYDY